MLLPRFSLRVLLLITTTASAFFYVVMLATQARLWAVAVTVAICSLFTTAILHAAVFALAWTLTAIGRSLRRRPAGSSPFASSGPPPQLISPREPD